MEIPVNKNEEYIVDIIDNGFEGEGIAKVDGYTIFVPNAIKGEKVKILILKVTVSHAFAKLVQIIEKSKDRVGEDCTTYKRCGGCNLRHIRYEKTLELKKEIVQNLVNKNLREELQVENTVGMENPIFYRNKAQYPIGKDKNGKAIVGVFANRTHEIIEFKECRIQTKVSQEIAKFIVEFINENNISVYNEKEGKGLFRHIVVKYGMKTNEVMCVLVCTNRNLPKEEELKNNEDLINSIKVNIKSEKGIALIVDNAKIKVVEPKEEKEEKTEKKTTAKKSTKKTAEKEEKEEKTEKKTTKKSTKK